MSRKVTEENDFELGLFGGEDETEEVAEVHRKLDIVRFQALEKQTVSNPVELFQGFKVLRVITFSSSESMIRNMIRHFEDAEIIFGDEKVLGNLNDKLAVQYATIKKLQSENKAGNDLIVKRIGDGTLSLYVTKLNSYTSHQKIFLLSDDAANRYRVITGSANFSQKAFGGEQLEIINVADDFRTYEIYRDLYEKTKLLSTWEISKDTIRELALDKLEELPAVQEVKTVKTLIVEEAPQEAKVDSYHLPMQEWKQFMREKNLDLNQFIKKQKGIRLLAYENVKKFAADAKAAFTAKEEVLRVYPQFWFDVDKNTVFFNGEPVDLDNISEDDVKNDISLFQEFFDGYFDPECEFTGDIPNGVKKYYATVNFAFCAPFISVTRARCPVGVEVINFPMFLLLHGITNAGKTFLTRFILHTMFNEYHVNIDGKNGLIRSASAKDNAPAELQKKIQACKGLPLVVDELESKNWRSYGERFIKTDYILDEHLSPVIFTTNGIGAIDEALNKRTVSFDIKMKTGRNSNLKTNRRMGCLQKMTGALYKLYLKEMLAKYPTYLESLSDETRKEPPDLLALSSKILKAIFAHYGFTDERFIDVYDRYYYLKTANTEENIKDLTDLYTKYSDEWVINRKHNFIRINFEKWYQARDFQNKYGSELVQYVAGQPFVTMDLKKMEDYLGITIGKEKSWWKIWDKD